MIFESPRAPVEIPRQTLPEFLFDTARQRPDDPAFIEGPTGRTLRFGEWMEAVCATAGGLAMRGLGPGDVVAIFSHNLPEYSVALLGTALAGGVCTPANPTYTAAELRKQLEDCKPRFVVAAPPFVEKVREAVQGLPVETIFVFGEAPGAEGFAALAAHRAAPPRIDIDPARHVAVLPYSSGTTGLPKGVMLTHRNLVANIVQALAACPGIHEARRVLGVLPFFHIYGMVVVMQVALRSGVCVVTMPRFEMNPMLETIERYRIGYAHLVPPVILGLARHPDIVRYELSSLRTIMSGAAPLSADVARACARHVGCRMTQGYGMTEASPVTHLATPDEFDAHPGTIGPPVAGTQVKLIGPDGATLPAGELGEICVRGPQVMLGYLGRPEATAAIIDADGWLHTGDLARCDAVGHCFIVDRVKELIKYKGMQVAPAELEALLLSHPTVLDAAVIGVADDEAGELPKAFLVLRCAETPETPEAVEAIEAIKAWVAERVAPHKRLRRVEVVKEIPRSPSGKILRRVLADRDRSRPRSG